MGSACQSSANLKSQSTLKNPTNTKEDKRSQDVLINQMKQFLCLSALNTNQLSLDTIGEEQQINLNSQKLNIQKSKISDFKIQRYLGSGAFGRVYLVKNKKINQQFAMKIIEKKLLKRKIDKVQTMTQRFILETIDCPFIVKLHYAFHNAVKYYLIIDLMVGGQLHYLIKQKKKLSLQATRIYAAEILIALQYLHNRNIIYRDLKPQNVLLDNQGHIKLTDFGISKVVRDNNQIVYSMCGTLLYMAPQVLKGKGYNKISDFYSLGAVIYCMLTGKPPFNQQDQIDLIDLKISKLAHIPKKLSRQAKSLLTGLLQIQSKKRLGFNGIKQIMMHEFFHGIDFDNVRKKLVDSPFAFNVSLNDKGFTGLVQKVKNSQLNGTSIKSQETEFGYTYCPGGKSIVRQYSQRYINSNMLMLKRKQNGLSQVNSCFTVSNSNEINEIIGLVSTGESVKTQQTNQKQEKAKRDEKSDRYLLPMLINQQNQDQEFQIQQIVNQFLN